MSAQFRYVTPIPPEQATGPAARVYGQVTADFGLRRMPVFMTLSPVPELLAATWALLRESLVAGEASRTEKEVVALGVSMANRCPFCVGAHTTLLHATGDHRLAETIASGGTPADPGHAALLAWATAFADGGLGTSAAPAPVAPAPVTPAGLSGPPAAGRIAAIGGTKATADRPSLVETIPPARRPYPAELAPEYVGTALTFHFINRVASALLSENLMPGGLQRFRVVRSAGGRAMAGVVRRRHPAGASLPLLDGLPRAKEARWAAGTPIATAYATLQAVAAEGEGLLTPTARAYVRDAVAAWDGRHPPLGGWPDLTPLPAADRPAARLVLLAALAPYRLSDADVAAWRTAAAGAGAAGSADGTGGDTGGGRDGGTGGGLDGGAAGGGDAGLVRLVALGAITATARVEAAIAAA